MRAGWVGTIVLLLSASAAGQVITAGSATGTPGSTVALPVTLTAGGPIEAFSFGLAHDGALLSLTGAVRGASLDALQGGIDPDFFSVDLTPAGGSGLTVGCVLDFGPAPLAALPAAVSNSVLDLTYTIAAGALPGSAPISFTAALGTPPVEIVFSVAGLEVFPTTTGGAVSVAAVPFRRGDTNGSGTVNIVDAEVILRRLFVTGEALTSCADADDADDDGAVAVTDAVFIIDFLFTGGLPIPAPVACGTDATADALGCDVFGACP